MGKNWEKNVNERCFKVQTFLHFWLFVHGTLSTSNIKFYKKKKRMVIDLRLDVTTFTDPLTNAFCRYYLVGVDLKQLAQTRTNLEYSNSFCMILLRGNFPAELFFIVQLLRLKSTFPSFSSFFFLDASKYLCNWYKRLFPLVRRSVGPVFLQYIAILKMVNMVRKVNHLNFSCV